MTYIERADTTIAFDDRPVPKRIGLLVLATDHTSERDFARLLPVDEVGVYVGRVAYANPTTPENLQRMLPDLAAAAGLILPGEPLDAICYSCTAASVVLGDVAIAEALTVGRPGTPVVTPPSAAVHALEAFGARRISILTPYTERTSTPVAGTFEHADFTVRRLTWLGLEDDREMARIAPASIVDAAIAAMTDDSDALFISCTALRSAGVVPEIEARIGRPVVTSNQATVWRCARFCGIDTSAIPLGRLAGVSP